MSVTKNYIYNVFYQVLILLLPIVTVPYISRVLGSYGVGLNAYTNSIVQYFVLIGTMGVSLYGNRAIAYVRDDKRKLSETFWGIFYLKLITTVAAYLLFLLFIFFTDSKDKNIYLIQSIYIISAAADISWFFMGIEDFKKTVTRNTIVKIIVVCFIFVLVKNKDDVWKYVLLLASAELIGQVVLWKSIKKYVIVSRMTIKEILKYFIPAISMFIPQLAIQIYAILDRTMVGVISTTSEVGYYDNAQKIIKISLAVVTSLGTVMLPKMTNTFANNDKVTIRKYIVKSFKFVSFLAFPIMFGIAGIASNFVPWFFGNEFLKCDILIVVISPIILAIAWSNVLGIQIMLPIGKNKEFTICVIIAAVVNFILNLFLIRSYASIGASISSVVAESIVTILQFYFLKDILPFKKMFSEMWKYVISSVAMFAAIKFLGSFMDTTIVTTATQVVVGCLVYFALLVLLRSSLNKNILNFVKKIRVARS